jgi:transcription elongation factor Elf1
MKVSLECTYCGHKWIETVYNQRSIEDKVCPNGNCRHKELKVKDLSSKIDYYQGSPPFQPSSIEIEWPTGMMGHL